MMALAGIALLFAADLSAAEAPPAPGRAPAIRETSPGRYQLGLVEVDANAGTLRFPAQVNMTEGQLEYVVVHETGKLHESLLKTGASPMHVHLGALLLRKGDESFSANTNEGGGLIQGPAVRVLIEAEGLPPRQAESWIRNTLIGDAMEKSGWVYNGSRLVDGTFLADRDGSIISIREDVDALVNSGHPDRLNDEIWEPITAAMGLGTAVEVIIEFERGGRSGAAKEQKE